jgi:transcriptional regulator ATRX
MRQVTKNALSQRVIDEHTLERHFTSEELRELYCFYPDIYDGTNEPYDLPKDDILKQLLIKNKKWIVKYHEHDSLLENKADEKLTDAERRRAWTEFETETKAAYHPTESNSEQSSFQQDESANCVIS